MQPLLWELRHTHAYLKIQVKKMKKKNGTK